GAPIPDASSPVFALRRLWVSNAREDAVRQIDPNSGRVIGNPVTVPRYASFAVGREGLWVVTSRAGSNTAMRIDPSSGKVLGPTVRVGSSTRDIEVALGSVWVATAGDNTVTQISAARNRVEHTVRVGRSPF